VNADLPQLYKYVANCKMVLYHAYTKTPVQRYIGNAWIYQ
jgi:hypothetical protein